MKRHHRKAEAKAKAKAKPKARPKPTARKQLQMLKDGIGIAVKQLREVQDALDEIDSFMFLCIEALRAQGANDIGPHVAMVLEIAYDKLVLGVNQNIRNALEALGQDGAK